WSSDVCSSDLATRRLHTTASPHNPSRKWDSGPPPSCGNWACSEKGRRKKTHTLFSLLPSTFSLPKTTAVVSRRLTLTSERLAKTQGVHAARIVEQLQPLKLDRKLAYQRQLHHRGMPRGAGSETRRDRLEQVDHQAIEEAQFRLQVEHAVLVHAGKPRRRFHRLADAAERIDETVFQRVRSGPHPALRDLPREFRLQAARRRDLVDEHAVEMIDGRLQGAARILAQRAVQAELPRQRRGADAIGVHADAVQGAFEGRKHRDHADRSGDGRRL